ncbi:MAG: dethiobiotin synthase [Alphaproteobacteria bacterium]|nr:dethiobiotin synthase [Alphaproteobacteria bacterium]
MPPRFFLTGTDTDVGKTVAAAALCAAGGHAYWKPVQAGLDGPTDTEVVQALAPDVPTWPEAWRLRRAASPHAAAADEGLRIDPRTLTLPPADRLLVEGAGGWMVPLAEGPVWQADLARHLGLPVVVVARTALGTLNHTFLTLRAVRDDGLEVAGLVLVGPDHPENVRDLHRWGAPVLARLPRVSLPDDFPRLVAEVARSRTAR